MRVLTAPTAGNLVIEAGSANVRIVVEELRKTVEVTLDATGPRSKEAADKATLVGDKLTVPAITGNTFATRGSMVNNNITGGTFFGTVVMSGGTLRNNRFRSGNISAGNVPEHLTVTVRIPERLSVTGSHLWRKRLLPVTTAEASTTGNDQRSLDPPGPAPIGPRDRTTPGACTPEPSGGPVGWHGARSGAAAR